MANMFSKFEPKKQQPVAVRLDENQGVASSAAGKKTSGQNMFSKFEPKKQQPAAVRLPESLQFQQGKTQSDPAHRETLREGNPLYNDDILGNAYKTYRSDRDIDIERAGAERRMQEANARLSDYAAKMVEQGAASMDDPTYQQLLGEKQAAMARIDELAAEKKSARNQRAAETYKTAAAQIRADQAEYFPKESAELDRTIAEAETQRDQSVAETERWKAANGEKLAALKAEYEELRKKGYDVPARLGASQISEYKRYQELGREISQLEQELDTLENAALAAENRIYYTNGAKTFAALTEDERQIVLDFVALRESGFAPSAVPNYNRSYTNFDGTQKEATVEQLKSVPEAYAALRESLMARGVSSEDIERMQKTMQAMYNERTRAAENVKTAEYAAEHPVLGSIGSVLTNLAGGISSSADLLLQSAENASKPGGYKAPLDFNTRNQVASAFTDTARGTVSQKISDGNGAAGQIGAFIYQTGMSGADSLLASFLGNTGGAAALGLGAAYSAAKDAHERGATDAQAMWTGVFAGVFETLFERVSIGNLNALKETPVATVKDVFLNIAKSAGVNASEEMATEAADLISDYLINGDLSEYEENYSARIASGETEVEARKNALLDMLKQIGMAGAGGALMGVGFAGGAGVYNYARGNRGNTAAGSLFTDENNRLDEESYSALLTEGLQSENAEIREYAARLGEKRDGVSQKEMGMLYRMLLSEHPDSNGAQDAVYEKLRRVAEEMYDGANDAVSPEISTQETVSAPMRMDNGGTTSTMQSERLFHDTNTPVRTEEIRARDIQEVARFAAGLGNAGRDVFVSMYDPDMDSAAYLEAMTVYYNAGKNGTDMERVKGNTDTLSILNSQMRKAAYLAGKSDKIIEQKSLALETNSGYTGNTYDAAVAALQTQNRYDAGGYTFQLTSTSDGWFAKIDAADADGIHTQTGAFPTRDAAVSAIVNQAKSRGIFKSENGGIVNDGGRTQQIDAESTGRISQTEEYARGTESAGRTGRKNEKVSIDSITERYSGRRLTQQQSEMGASSREHSAIQALVGQNVIPESQSFTAKEQQKAIEYGVPSFVIPDTVYDRFRGDKKQRYAFSYGGQIYLREHIPETYQDIGIVEHEATHIMRQLEYAPYMDFLQRTPDMIIFNSDAVYKLAERISTHTGVDIFNATPKQIEKFYDEINAGMYGHIAKGQVEELRAVYGDAFKDFDAYVQELTDIHEQFKHRDQQEAPNDAEEVQHAVSADETRTGEWTAERVGDRNKNPKPLSEIVEKIRHDFGIQITTGHIRGAGVLGQYNRRSKGIRSRKANDLPTIAHELGHHLDNLYGLREKISGAARDELINGLSSGMKSSYSKRLWLTEGIAEYIRKFLQNSSQAAIEYPKFTEFFKKSLSPKDLALIEQLADEVNAYFSLDTDTATSSIRLREDKSPDARTYGEKIKDISDAMYQSWTDTLHGIKRFDEAIGADTYKIATNSAYADAIAGEIITGDLTDANGQFVSGGLKEALHGINLQDKNEYLLFGEYLTVRHGPERRKENMHVFADDTKNDESFMNQRRAELEAAYPRFAEAAERLYRFQKQFLQTWGVDTGLVSQESADAWAERWKYYVPLNRAIPKSRFGGVKRGFANQNSTIHHAKGSGLDIIHPVDNIIANIAKMVTAGVRNNVMRLITDSAIRLGSNANFLEQVPPPVRVTNIDMTGTKEKLNDEIASADLDEAGKEVMFGIVAGIDDVLAQYGKGKAHGDTVTVLKNGKPEYWKINDPLLLESLVNMAPTQMNGIQDAYAVVSRFMASNITGNNLIWSIFSNLPRDMMTFFTYSKEKNPIKVFAAFGSAYVNKIKGDRADPLYKEFLAMGGGNMSAYSADRDLTKKARAKLIGKRSYNPLDLIAFVGDLIESGPRFATYRLMRQNGMTPQEAFYEAMDITVNFRRGGIYSRQLNQAVPFFNANVQGLDKFQRWITAEEAPRGKARLKAIRSRMIQYIVVSAALAALIYGLNNSDDDKEKEYEQLSNYTKNSYWNIPLGDGKYFAIPKPREIGVLSSFFETCMEYGFGKNDHAFDEFYDYAVGNFLPSIASDLAIGDWRGALGSFGIFGVGFYIGGNRDFLGKPIESAGMQNLEPKSRYTDRTSKIAYWVGQAFNTSPVMIDYFFTQTLGGWWKAQKALFPVGHESADYTLGVRNTYIKDNQYSTDLVNWMYDKAEQSKQKHNSAPEDAEKAITYKLDSVMTDFYSKYYSLAKSTNANGTAERGTRQVVLDMIHEYQKADDSGYLTDVQKAVYDVCKKDFEKEGEFNLLPAVMNTYVKDGADKIHNLDAVQYVEYQTDYLRLYWEIVEETLGEAKTQEARAAILKSAKTVAKEQATNRTLARIGANLTSYHDDFRGVDDEDVVRFKAALELAGLDGSLTQEEVIDAIKNMQEEQKIRDEAAYMLYHSRYDSDKNNPWKRYKPDWVE